MVELPPYTRTKIIVKFPINYKLAHQKMRDLLKSSFNTIVSILGILLKKPTLARFFKKVYKIKIVTVFPTLATLVLKYPSLDLIWG